MLAPPAPPPARTQRTYTPADRAAGLAALALHGGCVRKAAREVGVPARTLAGWRRAAPAAVGPDPTGPVVDELDKLARRLTGALMDATDAELRRLPWLQKVKCLGVLADLMVKARTCAEHLPGWVAPAVAPIDEVEYSRLSCSQLETLEGLLAVLHGHTPPADPPAGPYDRGPA